MVPADRVARTAAEERVAPVATDRVALEARAERAALSARAGLAGQAVRPARPKQRALGVLAPEACWAALVETQDRLLEAAGAAAQVVRGLATKAHLLAARVSFTTRRISRGIS